MQIFPTEILRFWYHSRVTWKDPDNVSVILKENAGGHLLKYVHKYRTKYDLSTLLIIPKKM